jgi:hypothetical protein
VVRTLDAHSDKVDEDKSVLFPHAEDVNATSNIRGDFLEAPNIVGKSMSLPSYALKVNDVESTHTQGKGHISHCPPSSTLDNVNSFSNSVKAPTQGDTDNLPSDALSPSSSPPSPSIPIEHYPFVPSTILGSVIKSDYLLCSKSRSVSLIEHEGGHWPWMGEEGYLGLNNRVLEFLEICFSKIHLYIPNKNRYWKYKSGY